MKLEFGVGKDKDMAKVLHEKAVESKDLEQATKRLLELLSGDNTTLFGV